MKTTSMTGTARVGIAPHARVAHLRSDAPCVDADTTPLRLQHALAQLEDLRRALASIRGEWIAARQQLALLAQTNAQLRQVAIARAQEVTKARHCAYHDELTGLPNRALLLDRLNQALVRAKRRRKPLALLFLDLDGFKAINDRLGHGAGDTLLQRVAERLLSCTRGGDTACRYGGDEFVLLLPEVDDEARAMAVAQMIRARLAIPIMVDDVAIVVTASIGIAVSPVEGASQNDLIKQADAAMYHAKTLNGSSTAHTRMSARAMMASSGND